MHIGSALSTPAPTPTAATAATAITAATTACSQHPATLRVLAARAEVLFRDGSRIGLHPVAAAGMPMLFLRAIRGASGVDGPHWTVFDLRHLGAPEIEADLLRAEQRDRQGVIYFTLRGLFPSATAFTAAALACAQASWWQHDTADVDGAAA